MNRTRTARSRTRPSRTEPTVSIEAWSGKEDPISYVRALFAPFRVPIRARDVDRDVSEQYVQHLAEKHGVFVHELPGGSADAHGFIVADRRLTLRQLESIEADHWGDPDPWEDR